MAIVIPKKLKTLMETDSAFNEAATLAISMFKRFYYSNEAFELCDSTEGVISQIDNMVSGLAKPVKVKPLVWEGNNRAYTTLGTICIHKKISDPTDQYYCKKSAFNLSFPYNLLDLESAKQVAQAQYEKMVLGSIE